MSRNQFDQNFVAKMHIQTPTKMSDLKPQMGFLRKKREKIDPNVEQFETDIRNSYQVSCRDNLNEYLHNSSLHGLQYCGDRRISRFER